MKNYQTIQEAVKALKEATGCGRVVYFVNRKQVTASEYRQASGVENIYRSGLEIHAEKTDK